MKLKERIMNNWSLKLLSIGIAIAIWIIVVNYDNPYTTRTITGIPIDVVHAETITDNDMVYTVVSGQTATVRVRCPRKLAQSLKVSDFIAEADFNDMYDLTNQIPVTIVCTHAGVTNDEFTSLTPSLEVELEKVETRRLDIQVKVTGSPQDGYQVGNVTTSPSAITVKAPQSFLDQISYIGVSVDVDGVSRTVNERVPIQFYNAGGNILSSDDVQALYVSSEYIHVEVEILNVKSVGISYTVTGQDSVPEGYQYAGVELSRTSVSVSGRRSALAEVSSITIPAGELDVSGASSNVVKEIDLTGYLPDGVSLADEKEAKLTVTLKIERVSTKEFTLSLSDLRVKNLASDLELKDSDAETVIKIQGLASDLEELSREELNASIDLGGLSRGSHQVEVQISQLSGFRVVNQPRITIRLLTKSTEDTAGEDTREQEESEETTTAAEEPSEEEPEAEESQEPEQEP